MTINIVFPVLNEEIRLEKGIERSAQYIINENIDAIITIVDNGSTDKTPIIAKALCDKYSFVKYMKISQKGVGVAFRRAVEENTMDIVGYMDVDLSTDISYISKVLDIFQNQKDIQIVNASRLNKEAKVIDRKISREMTSRGLNLILKVFLQVKMTDAMCGFKFFRKSIIECLLENSSKDNGWFLCAELIIIAERLKVPIYELPVVWEDDHNSSVHVFKLMVQYIRHIGKLFWRLNVKREFDGKSIDNMGGGKNNDI